MRVCSSEPTSMIETRLNSNVCSSGDSQSPRPPLSTAHATAEATCTSRLPMLLRYQPRFRRSTLRSTEPTTAPTAVSTVSTIAAETNTTLDCVH
eukprot:m.133296 g.133296  ORF g.133296 m.133296 type:complete len:94 (+) comp11354_c0_seq4:664-945(+)